MTSLASGGGYTTSHSSDKERYLQLGSIKQAAGLVIYVIPRSAWELKTIIQWVKYGLVNTHATFYS